MCWLVQPTVDVVASTYPRHIVPQIITQFSFSVLYRGMIYNSLIAHIQSRCLHAIIVLYIALLLTKTVIKLLKSTTPLCLSYLYAEAGQYLLWVPLYVTVWSQAFCWDLMNIKRWGGTSLLGGTEESVFVIVHGMQQIIPKRISSTSVCLRWTYYILQQFSNP